MNMQGINIVGEADFQANFPSVMSKVEAGEVVTITRNGAPVARLVPAMKENSRERRRQAIERIKKLSERLTLGGLKVRDMIEEGRR